MKARRALWIQDVDRTSWPQFLSASDECRNPIPPAGAFLLFGTIYATWSPFRASCGIARRSLKGDAMECHILVFVLFNRSRRYLYNIFI